MWGCVFCIRWSFLIVVKRGERERGRKEGERE